MVLSLILNPVKNARLPDMAISSPDVQRAPLAAHTVFRVPCLLVHFARTNSQRRNGSRHNRDHNLKEDGVPGLWRDNGVKLVECLHFSGLTVASLCFPLLAFVELEVYTPTSSALLCVDLANLKEVWSGCCAIGCICPCPIDHIDLYCYMMLFLLFLRWGWPSGRYSVNQLSLYSWTTT